MNHLNRNNGPYLAFGAFLVLLASLLAFDFHYPPLADYVEWIYQSFILNHLAQGDSVARFYVRDYPVPYVTAQVLMAALIQVMSPAWAGKWLLLIYFALAAWLSMKFVKRHQLQPLLAYPLLLSCIIASSSFWSGYMNYQFGLLVLMAYLSLDEKSQEKIWVNALFSMLAFACHGFCLVAFFVIAGFKALTGGWRSVVAFAMAGLPAVALTLWYMIARNNDAMSEITTPVAYLSLDFWKYKFYTLTKAGPYQNFLLGAQGDFQRTPYYYGVGVLVNVLVGITILALQGKALKGLFSAPKRYLSLSVALLALAYIFTPALAMQVVNPGERLLYPQLLCVFALTLGQDGAREKSQLMHKSAFWVGATVYALLVATLLNLTWITHTQGYESVTKSQYEEVKKNYSKILYLHRPYQLKERFDYLTDAHQRDQHPEMNMMFPTSLIGDKNSLRAGLIRTDKLPDTAP